MKTQKQKRINEWRDFILSIHELNLNDYDSSYRPLRDDIDPDYKRRSKRLDGNLVPIVGFEVPSPYIDLGGEICVRVQVIVATPWKDFKGIVMIAMTDNDDWSLHKSFKINDPADWDAWENGESFQALDEARRLYRQMPVFLTSDWITSKGFEAW